MVLLRRRRAVRIAVLSLACAVVAGAAAAQFGQWGRVMEGPGVPVQLPAKGFDDGAFYVCKLMYTSVYREPLGMGWATDYPYAGINLMTRVSELTKTPISRSKHGEPNYWVVAATDDALFRCPYVMAADVGTLEFSAEEAARMREYLLKGGFLWVDDFWGTPAWQQWSSQILKVLPEYRIVDVPADHTMRRMMFEITKIPQVTAIQNWGGPGSSTAERGADSPHPNFRAIADEKGRVMVLMTHNTDIADSWERESEDRRFFLEFSPDGYALGINVVLYSLTH
jgi:hypothetical protein